MKGVSIMLIFLLISNLSLAQYGGQNYGGGYNQQQGGYGQQTGDQQQGDQTTKGKTGLERKGLTDSMDIGDKTSLTEDEKCKTKCNMTFVQCYRLQTDRSKCYATQQECLGKCGGDADSNPDFNSKPQDQGGGQIGF